MIIKVRGQEWDLRGRVRRNNDLQSKVEGWMEQNSRIKAQEKIWDAVTSNARKVFHDGDIYSLYQMRNDWRNLREKDHGMTATIVKRADNLND